MTTAQTGGKLLKVREAGDRLGLGKTKIYELIARGELASLKIDGARRVSEHAIQDFIASREAGVGAA